MDDSQTKIDDIQMLWEINGSQRLNNHRNRRAVSILYSPVVWGEIRHFGGVTSGGMGCAPVGSRGEAPGQVVWGANPPETESFSLHKYLTFALYEAFMQNLVPVNLAVSNVRCKNFLGSLGGI